LGADFDQWPGSMYWLRPIVVARIDNQHITYSCSELSICHYPSK
jgi:hypothetical protein